MSRWSEIFLGIIAISSLATSVILIALLLAAVRLARRVESLTSHLEQELKPVLIQLNAMARDAARAASLATLQVERVDRLMGNFTYQVDSVFGAVQGLMGGPLAKGGNVAAAFSAIRAVLGALRTARGRRRKDDEDALFI